MLKDAQLAVALIQLSLASAVLLMLAELGPKYVQDLMATSQYNGTIWLIAPAGAYRSGQAFDEPG